MNYYRLEYKYTEEVGKTFPQSQHVKSNLHIDDPNHLRQFWGWKIPDDAYIPDSILHRHAKLTDLISSSPIIYPIISDRLKQIIAKYRGSDLQFLPTHVIVKGRKIDYWIMNGFSYDYQYINFDKSIISEVGLGGVKISGLEICLKD